ncbi:MAG: NADH-quinone oxidoreductase subunit C [Dehalococcoidales bacterium]|nr:NADH-quinone oxidoreductase subunit C [Dehalococcoidales bacterium]
MTKPASTKQVAESLEKEAPGCVIESSDNDIVVKPESLSAVASYLKNSPEMDFDYLNWVTAVDYPEHFLVVYNLVSLKNNLSLTLKVPCNDRENPTVPSLVGIWKGADLQEREIFDLMGIRFENHPNLKRIVLWDDFIGYPLRKDFKQE